MFTIKEKKTAAGGHVHAKLVAALSVPLVGSQHYSASPKDAAANGGTSLSAVFSLAHIGILHRDLDNRVLVVNDHYQAIVGLSAEDLDGLPMEAFTHPSDRERSSSLYNQQLARAEPFEVEKRYIRPDGSSIWCSVHVSFVMDDGGRPISTISVAHDITARRVAEQELRESEEHHRYSVELNPQISWTAKPNGDVETVSARWRDVTGNDPAKALGEGWVAALHPEDAGPTLKSWRHSLGTREPVDVEYRVRIAGGRYRWFRSRATARLDDSGAVIRWYGTIDDIHDRKLAEQDVSESEERLRIAAQAAGLGIWDYDAVRDRREWSKELREMFGVGPEAEPVIATALALVVPEDRPLLEQLIADVYAGVSEPRYDLTLRIRREDTGAERWMRLSGWRMEASPGKLSRVLVTVRDVTEERAAEERIRWIAEHDALTGLPNRAAFNAHLERSITTAQEAGGKLALLLFDMDNLKTTNDTIGHDAGDVLLQTFVNRLEGALPSGCMLGRLGGDEFAVLIDATDEGALKPLLAAAHESFQEPFAYEGITLNCAATAGAALFPDHAANAAELLKMADIALYAGKVNGRGTWWMFQPGMRADLQVRASMLSLVRVVVRERRIVPYYQPQISLTDGRITGFEALLRWRHDTLGVQAPATIAAAFDDFELAIKLGERMLELVLEDAKSWLDQGVDFGRIAFNLSPAEFRNEELVPRLLERLQRAGVPPSCFELEVTESVFLDRSTKGIRSALDTFRRAGILIALDDFGTGFASLTHLKAFPVDIIKIDRSFVSNLSAGSEDAAIVDAVIELGHRLGMRVIAEGVETIEQARYISQAGCDIGQGYLFARALPAEDAMGLARSGAMPVAQYSAGHCPN